MAIKKLNHNLKRGQTVKSFRVCVADDNREEAFLLCEGLKINGYDAVSVHNGYDAITKCTEEDIDLLLLDIGLPDIEGYDVCKLLKENPATRDISIIFVTARGDSHDVAQGFALGAVDYIPKPYNLPFVMVSVESAMRTKQLPNPMNISQELIYEAQELLHDTVYTDQLTGLRNRRFFMERLQEEVERARRYGFALSCVIIDVDELRPLDSDLGTASLDDLLVEIAMAMRDNSRNFDILARYESSVFSAALPHAPLEDAVGYANKIRERLSKLTFGEPPTKALLTFGIVSCSNSNSECAESMLCEAMRGLLTAKSSSEERMYAKNL